MVAPAILKKSKNRNISATERPKLGTVVRLGPCLHIKFYAFKNLT